MREILGYIELLEGRIDANHKIRNIEDFVAKLDTVTKHISDIYIMKKKELVLQEFDMDRIIQGLMSISNATSTDAWKTKGSYIWKILNEMHRYVAARQTLMEYKKAYLHIDAGDFVSAEKRLKSAMAKTNSSKIHIRVRFILEMYTRTLSGTSLGKL